MALPFIQSPDRILSQVETQWKAILDPIIASPTTNLQILKGINLVVGANTINHRLGNTLQGWIIVDQTGAAQIYRSKPKNDLTLTLNSSAVVTIDLAVF